MLEAGSEPTLIFKLMCGQSQPARGSQSRSLDCSMSSTHHQRREWNTENRMRHDDGAAMLGRLLDGLGGNAGGADVYGEGAWSFATPPVGFLAAVATGEVAHLQHPCLPLLPLYASLRHTACLGRYQRDTHTWPATRRRPVAAKNSPPGAGTEVRVETREEVSEWCMESHCTVVLEREDKEA